MASHDDFLGTRREESERRLNSFRSALDAELGSDEAALIGSHTTVYVVGSGGRGELSPQSDLDAFLVTTEEATQLQAIPLQAAFLRALAKERFVPPSRDASFLKLQTMDALIERLGEPRDDHENTLTVRMLLLLESKCLVGKESYDALVRAALDAYWKHEHSHRDDYLPIVLVNDIIRYWRILLLNYELKTKEKENEAQKNDASFATVEADRRLRSSKLRFSRCLMCYATVARLLAECARTRDTAGKAHVARSVVERIVQLTPLERLAEVADCVPAVAGQLDELRALYAGFLRMTELPKRELLEVFGADDRRSETREPSLLFSQKMFELLESLGRDNPLYRYVVL